MQDGGPVLARRSPFYHTAPGEATPQAELVGPGHPTCHLDAERADWPS